MPARRRSTDAFGPARSHIIDSSEYPTRSSASESWHRRRGTDRWLPQIGAVRNSAATPLDRSTHLLLSGDDDDDVRMCVTVRATFDANGACPSSMGPPRRGGSFTPERHRTRRRLGLERRRESRDVLKRSALPDSRDGANPLAPGPDTSAGMRAGASPHQFPRPAVAGASGGRPGIGNRLDVSR